MQEVSVADRIVRDRVMFGMPVAEIARVHAVSVDQVKDVLAANPDKVRGMVSARRAIEKRKYLDMAPQAMRAIKKILAMDPMEEVLSKGEPTGIRRVNAHVLRVQREAAEGILESAGAKRAKAGGGGVRVAIQNNAGRSRKRGASPAERPVSAILDACVLEQSEVKLIPEESSGEAEK